METQARGRGKKLGSFQQFIQERSISATRSAQRKEFFRRKKGLVPALPVQREHDFHKKKGKKDPCFRRRRAVRLRNPLTLETPERNKRKGVILFLENLETTKDKTPSAKKKKLSPLKKSGGPKAAV